MDTGWKWPARAIAHCFEDKELGEGTSTQKVVVHDTCIIHTAGFQLKLIQTNLGVVAVPEMGILKPGHRWRFRGLE